MKYTKARELIAEALEQLGEVTRDIIPPRGVVPAGNPDHNDYIEGSIGGIDIMSDPGNRPPAPPPQATPKPKPKPTVPKTDWDRFDRGRNIQRNYDNMIWSTRPPIDVRIAEALEQLDEGAVKSSMEDWLTDLPKGAVSELKAKHGKELAHTGGMTGYRDIGTKKTAALHRSIVDILKKHNVPKLLGSHHQGSSAIQMSFHTYHGDIK